MDIEKQFQNHIHNGIDSKKLQLSDMLGDLSDIDGDLSDIVTPSATISDPSGGLTVDAEARTAINAIIDLLQSQGLME